MRNLLFCTSVLLLLMKSSGLYAQVEEKYFAVGLNLPLIINNNYEFTTDTYLSRHFDIVANIGFCPNSWGNVMQYKMDQGCFEVFAHGIYMKLGGIYKYNFGGGHLFGGIVGIASLYKQTGKQELYRNESDEVAYLKDKGIAKGIGLIGGVSFKIDTRLYVDAGAQISYYNSRKSSFKYSTYTPGFGAMGVMPISKIKYLF